MNTKPYLVVVILTCVAMLLLNACSKGVTHDTSPSTDTGDVRTAVSPSPANRSNAPSAPRTPGGTPIDTSRLDSNIAQAENTNQQKPGDSDARAALAHAYLARADALTKAQQYGSALGDYRRTL